MGQPLCLMFSLIYKLLLVDWTGTGCFPFNSESIMYNFHLYLSHSLFWYNGLYTNLNRHSLSWLFLSCFFINQSHLQNFKILPYFLGGREWVGEGEAGMLMTWLDDWWPHDHKAKNSLLNNTPQISTISRYINIMRGISLINIEAKIKIR